jgi:hypothetical protein
LAAPAKLNYTIYQGGTFREVYRWESSSRVYVPITNVTNTAPVVITAPEHNIPSGWRCWVTGVSGMKQINTRDDEYYVVTQKTTNTVTLNNVNATSFSPYTSGGMLEYNEPMPLLGITARMQIRQTVSSPTVITELTTQNGGIVIDQINNTITIIIDSSITENMNFTTAVYSVELLYQSDVIQFLYGTLTLVKEVTR